MIVYDSHFWGLPLLGRIYGSAFPRAMLFAGASASATAMLYQYGPATLTSALRNPTPYQVFAFVVGFALVFRSSLSYQRFWEARTMIQTMMGKLTSFTVQTLSADLAAVKPETMNMDQKLASFMFAADLIHYISLLFVLMLKHLRKDWNLEDTYRHLMHSTPPFLDASTAVHGWRKVEVFFVRMLSLNDLFGMGQPQQEASMPVIAGVSDKERAQLQCLVQQLMKGRGGSINGARPFAVYAWINGLFIKRIGAGALNINGSLVGRLPGMADDAMSAFGQCNKLASTQFPFPWAQVVMAFLVMMAASLPFVIVAFISELWLGVVLTFIIVLTYWSLNEVASEMEDPFGFDPNDLPMARYAFDLNQNLITAAYQLRPEFFDEVEERYGLVLGHHHEKMLDMVGAAKAVRGVAAFAAAAAAASRISNTGAAYTPVPTAESELRHGVEGPGWHVNINQPTDQRASLPGSVPTAEIRAAAGSGVGGIGQPELVTDVAVSPSSVTSNGRVKRVVQLAEHDSPPGNKAPVTPGTSMPTSPVHGRTWPVSNGQGNPPVAAGVGGSVTGGGGGGPSRVVSQVGGPDVVASGASTTRSRSKASVFPIPNE